MNNICKRCGRSFSDIITSKGKPSKKCAKCLELRKRQEKERNRRFYAENRQKYKEMRFRQALKYKYNITIEDYENIWKSQNGKCDICGIELVRLSVFGKPDKTMPCVDHNHETGKVRGILCRGCNLRLEILDKKHFLEKSIQYLKKFEM